MNKFVMFITLSLGLVNIVKSQDVQKPKGTFEELLKCIHSLRDHYSKEKESALHMVLLFQDDRVFEEQDEKGKTLSMHMFECGLYGLLELFIYTSYPEGLRLENNDGKTLFNLISDRLDVEVISDSCKSDLSKLMAQIGKLLHEHRDLISLKVFAGAKKALWFREAGDSELMNDEELKHFSIKNDLSKLISEYV